VVVGEEIGVLGTTLSCAFVMPSIVGEALHVFGTDEQKERFLKPILQGKLVSAEALTEPRGGSDFFGATTRAEIDGDHFVLNGQKRFVVGATEADVFWSIVEPILVKTFTNTNASARLWLKMVPASSRSTSMD
jgi:alkylation response protein AidB-like acyl-CoA dehydrogenase